MGSKTNEARPAFLKEAEERAVREGISVKAVLAADQDRLRSTAYPGPDCLDPSEVEQLMSVAAAQPVWAESRLSHVEQCDDCATLLLACAPGEHSLERTIAAVRERVAEVLPVQAKPDTRAGIDKREPAWEAVLGLAPLSFALAGLWVWGATRPGGIPARAVSIMGWAAGASVLLTAAAIGVSTPVAAWLRNATGALAPARFAAGALVGGLAAAFIVLGLGFAGFSLAGRQMSALRQSAETAIQSEALQALALRHQTGKTLDLSTRLAALSVTTEPLPDGARYESRLAGFGARSGMLVAHVTDSGGQVFWSDPKGGQTIQAAQLYLGKLVAAKAGELTFVDSNGKKHQAPYEPNSLSVPSLGTEVAVAIDNQGRVTGLYPAPRPNPEPMSPARVEHP